MKSESKSFILHGKGGTPFRFKIVEKSDKELIRKGFGMLSQKSVYTRFFSFIKELSEEQLDELTHADQKKHVIWGGFIESNKQRTGIGLGRYCICEKDNNNTAEMAITIVDSYQNEGVGTILLAIIYFFADCAHLDYLVGYILVENWKFAVRFLKLGATITRTGNEYEIKLPIYSDYKQFPKNNYSKLFAKTLKQLKKQNLCE